MSVSGDTYRAEAERCRQLAITCRDQDAAQRYRQLAANYEELSKAFYEMHARTRQLQAAAAPKPPIASAA